MTGSTGGKDREMRTHVALREIVSLATAPGYKVIKGKGSSFDFARSRRSKLTTSIADTFLYTRYC